MPKEIRLAVGTTEELRSSVWKLWGQKDDAYLAARTPGGLTKFSFHASGIFRFAMSSGSPRPATHRWMRPDARPEGLTPLIDIIAPGEPTRALTFRNTAQATSKVELLEPPPAGEVKLIRLFLAPKDLENDDLLSVFGHSSCKLHGPVLLLRERAWAISFDSTPTENYGSFLSKLMSETKINFQAGTNLDEITEMSLHVLGTDVQPPRVVDLQVGRDNLGVDPT